VIGFEKRLRLKINMGEGCDKIRKLYRGDQLEHYEEVDIKDLHVLNEVTLDRGPSPYSVQLNIQLFGTQLTSTVGDGVIISTPTGSTAYNLSAGGSIVETSTHCIQLTPLAPHSLSFRPLIVPDTAVLRVEKYRDNRNPAWVSLDGANRFILQDGESIVIEGS
jgi:NAD+ kinase